MIGSGFLCLLLLSLLVGVSCLFGDEEEAVVVAEAFFCVEVNEFDGVERVAEESEFVVEMRSGGMASAAAEADRVASLDILVNFYEDSGHVSHDGLEAVVVADDDVMAVTFALVVDDADLAGKCCPDGVADVEAYVNAVMEARVSPAVVGCHEVAVGGVDIVAAVDVNRIEH